MHKAYTAGIIDGEGCLSLRPSAGNLYPRVTVSNTSLELVEYLQQVWGGWIHKRSDRKPGYKQAYQWGLTSSREIAILLEAIYPHMIVKKKQAEFLLTHVSSHNNTAKWFRDQVLDAARSVTERYVSS